MEFTIFQYLQQIFSIAIVVMIALVSPGPDFAVVVRNSLIYSRRTGIISAFGIAVGTFIHVSYTLLGLGLIITESTWLLLWIKYCGAGYLLYIGLKGILAKKSSFSLDGMQDINDISILQAFASGFFTCLLNPKAILFFISFLSVMIDPSTPKLIMLAYGITIFIETFTWFGFVAFFLSGKRIREKFYATSHWIERITGFILIALSLKLLL